MKKQQKKDKAMIAVWAIFIILIIYSLSLFFVLGWGLITSLKSDIEFGRVGNKVGIPTWGYSANEILFGNYLKVINNFELKVSANYWRGETLVNTTRLVYFPNLLFNTLVYALGGAIIAAFVPCIMAYFCAKYKYKFSSLLYTLVIFVMIIPVVGTQPATINLLRDTGLYDTFIGSYVLKFSFQGTYFLVFFAFFEGLTDSYAEAAEIDGATQFDILFRITLPLVSKMIGTVILIQFIALWDDYQTSNLYLPTHPTLAYGVYRMVYDSGSSKGFNAVPVKISGCMLLVIPMLILFACLKDKIMGNVSMGGLKE